MSFGKARTIVRETRSKGWLVVALIVGIPVLSAAQSTTGTIRGVVRDQQGARRPRRHVTIRQTDTNLVRTAATGPQGEYLVTNLPTGNYEVTAEIAAFNQLRPVRHHAGGQSGRRHRRHADGGRPDRNDLRHVRCVGSEYDDRRSGRAVRYDARVGAAGGQQPRRLQPGAFSARRQPVEQRPGWLCRRRRLRGERPARPIEQHDGRRSGQQRPQRHRRHAADQQHRHRAGGAAHHQSVRGRVRPRCRFGDERDHQERHQPVSADPASSSIRTTN